MLNMSDILDDFSEEDGFTQEVIRIVQYEEIDDHGRTVLVEKKKTIQAVISTPSSAFVQRFPDNTIYNKFICITSTSPLNPDTTLTQPDQIEYKQDRYVIIGIDEYLSNGFNRAIAGLLNKQQTMVNK